MIGSMCCCYKPLPTSNDKVLLAASLGAIYAGNLPSDISVINCYGRFGYVYDSPYSAGDIIGTRGGDFLEYESLGSIRSFFDRLFPDLEMYGFAWYLPQYSGVGAHYPPLSSDYNGNSPLERYCVENNVVPYNYKVNVNCEYRGKVNA